jgi:hypothetical protein
MRGQHVTLLRVCELFEYRHTEGLAFLQAPTEITFTLAPQKCGRSESKEWRGKICILRHGVGRLQCCHYAISKQIDCAIQTKQNKKSK